jgi:alkanesulfonate monooxygenase SsuD/methylene tetrahydromethanopterin reductase-like flavin-dependent oxidoreductase (luciferase family)
MKIAYFSTLSHGRTRQPATSWPVPNELFDPEQALRMQDEYFAECRLADEMGFDWVSIAEHHYSPGSLAPSINVLGAALAQHVKRAKIAILGALLPLNNPVRVAEELAMVDMLSNGRLVAGLLRGAPFEYLVYNVAPSESRSRFEEAWDLIHTAWTDTQPFGWEGEHYQFRNVSIWPRPIQQPTPPILVSGSSKDSGEFAARKKVSLGLAFTTFDLATGAAAYYRERCDAWGWMPTPENVLYRAQCYVADSDEKAATDMQTQQGGAGGIGGGIANANRLVAMSGFFGQRDANLTERFSTMGQHHGPPTLQQQIDSGSIVCGSPDSVAAQLKRLYDSIGCGVVELSFSAPGGSREAKLHSMELFANQVLPKVRDL